ncbi:MAG TPA: hypothetical protein VGC19_07420 [Rhodanobacter sp.]
MKLLRDFIRLRAAGRRLLSGRRDARGRSYAVTVPQPLHAATVSYLPATASEHAAQPAASPTTLRLAAGH